MTRDDFKRIPILRREIRKQLVLWENAKELATRTTTLLTGMPKGSQVGSQVENAIVKAEQYREIYDSLCEELKDIYSRMKKESDIKLSEIESSVIEKAFKQARKMPDIAKDLNITERHAYRVKKTAIAKLCQ